MTTYIMATKKDLLIKAVIEKANDGGYGIYTPEINGIPLYGYGLSEEEAKANLLENLEMTVEHYEEKNLSLPLEINEGHINFDYVYDLSGFFLSFPVFNVSELANFLKINSSLLRKYKQGITFASEEQKKKIESGIHELAEKLNAVRF